jgi:serine/threonine-protein kinase
MTPDQFARLKRLFEQAIEDPGRRLALLREAADDSEIAAALERMLAADGSAGAFLESAATFGAAVDMPPPPACLGPYLIQKEIGRGGMSVVYLATRPDLANRLFAVKLLGGDAASPDVLRRFRRERDTLARLDHPHIARLIDGGADATGRPYLVLDFVDGLPLDGYCRAHRPSVEARLAMFRTIANAVHFAHQHLVIHQDLKPGNVLVDRLGHPRLVDFGISKIVAPDDGAGPDPTRTAIHAMTPAYASPEQFAGALVSTASDVYSLGVMLHELLTGVRPMEVAGHGGVECAPPSEAALKRPDAGRAADLAPPLSPRALSRRLRGDLDVILLKALERDPARRYASAEQFAADLDRHLRGLPVEATPDAVLYRLTKFVRRHRVSVAAAVLVLASILGGAGVAVYQGMAARRASARAERLNAFMQQVFVSAAPTEGRRDMTVLESLERAAIRAEVDLAAEPDSLAEMLINIGQTFTELGQLDKGGALLRKAYRDVLARHGERHPLTIRAQLWSAVLDRFAGNLESSETALRRAVALSDETLDPDHELRGQTRQFLGVVLIESGREAEGLELTKQALAVFERAPDRHARVIGTLKNNLAVSAYNQGRLEDARVLYEEAIAANRAARLDAELAPPLINLGVVYRMQERYGDAERVLREGVALRVKTLGAEHPFVAIGLAHLGDTLLRTGRIAESRAELEKALAIQRKTLPAGHVDLARSTSVLGLLECRTGHSLLGERLLREALAVRKKHLPAGHWLTASVESALGECLTLAGRQAEAQPILERAAHDVEKTLGAGHPMTKEAFARLRTP